MDPNLVALFDCDGVSVNDHRVAVYLPSVEDKSLVNDNDVVKDKEDYNELHMITIEFLCRELGEVTKFSAENFWIDDLKKTHLQKVEIVECFCNGIVLTAAAGKLRQFFGIAALAFDLPHITAVIDGNSVDFRPREIDRTEYLKACAQDVQSSPVAQVVFERLKFWKVTPAAIV